MPPGKDRLQQPVSAGEYCTIVRAREMGILDDALFGDKNSRAAPFGKEFADLKTFNSATDTRDKRTRSLCKETMDGRAYPHCTAMHGPGFVKRGNADASQPVKCQTYDCPPGFTRDGENCKKKLYDAKVDKRSRCDERWSDWFAIPNYHLGNKYYQAAVGKCFAPCPPQHVPNMGTDPVDGQRMGFTAEDKPATCTPIDTYFMGKYADGSEYCPLATIMRTYASNPAHAKQLLHRQRTRAMAAAGSGRATTLLRAAADLNGNILNGEAQSLAMQVAGGGAANVEAPRGASQQACGALNSEQRLDQAYSICSSLKEQEVLSLSPDQATNQRRNIMLKQACNAVFCHDNEDALDIVGRDPICFQKPGDVDGVQDAGQAAPTYASQQRFFWGSFVVALVLLIVPVFGVLAYTGWSRFMWPVVVKPGYVALLRLLTGRRHGAIAYRDARMAELSGQ